MFQFQNRTVLLTGSTGGIGSTTLDLFIKNGAKVIALGRSQEKLSQISDLYGDKVITVRCDLGSHDDINELAGKVYEKVTTVDILVCNAGITADNLSMRMKKDEWDEVIKVNLTSTFLLNQIFLKKMMTNRYGRVINIASVVGFTGNLGQANYCASKAGIVGMSKSLAIEYAARNITVNVIAPGFIETDMTAHLPDTIKEKIKENIPSRRFGQTKDVANAILFLASEESGYITGSTIHVNGGLFMP